MNLPEKSVRQQIASAITIVVQATRMSDGTRKMTSISEITGMEENVISMQEIFTFPEERHRTGRQGDRRVSARPASVPGSWSGCGCRASCCRRACLSGKRRSIKRKGGSQRWD